MSEISKDERIYRLAIHIASSKNGLPDEWQTWADEIESDLRELLALREKVEPVGYIDPASLKDYRGQKAGGTWSPAPNTSGYHNQILPIFLAAPPAPVAAGWIKCSERLPEVGDIVLTADNGCVNVGEMERSGANYRYFTSVVSGSELPATHWMPLPEAPTKN